MRISDWSSDVCSSDLEHADEHHHRQQRDAEQPGGDPQQRIARAARRRECVAEGIAVDAEVQCGHRWNSRRETIGASRAGSIVRGEAGVVRSSLNECQDASASSLLDWAGLADGGRSEEQTSELQSLMRISYAVFCLKKKK